MLLSCHILSCFLTYGIVTSYFKVMFCVTVLSCFCSRKQQCQCISGSRHPVGDPHPPCHRHGNDVPSEDNQPHRECDNILCVWNFVHLHSVSTTNGQCQQISMAFKKYIYITIIILQKYYI